MSSDPVLTALRAAWSGAEPEPPDHTRRPPPTPQISGPVIGLRRWPADDLGGLLDLALAGDPHRIVGGVRLRRVPSAGGRYPVDAHIVHDGASRLYDPLAHTLTGPAPPPHPGDPLQIMLTLDPGRTVWRYGPRSLPVLLLDLGHAIAALLAAAACLGLPAEAVTGHAATVGVGAPPTDHDRILAVVHVGELPSESPTIRTFSSGAQPLVARYPPTPQSAMLETIQTALTVLGTKADALQIPQNPAHDAATLVERSSAPWESLTRQATNSRPATLTSIAQDRLGQNQQAHLLQRTEAPNLLTALALRTCGQSQLAHTPAALLITGDEHPDPATALHQHLRAGIAIHDAWLTATAAQIPARPIGCWIDAILDGPSGHQRVLHALALGE